METKNTNTGGHSMAVLPWIIAVAALIGYLLTLNTWITTGNIAHVSRVSGLEWAPTVMAPLTYIITLPAKLFPYKLQPLVLNIISALLAAGALGMLARSVILFPQDRTRDQRSREKNEFGLLSTRWAWLPPLVAVLACGLHLTFWRNAISNVGEMLDLFIFAYLIRCLLEYRIGENDKWLYKFAFVYGLSMTNNWAMIGFLPVAAVAVIWIKGIEFFNLQFLGKFIGLFIVGLLMYLFLPVLTLIQNPGQYTFWELLKGEIGQQKMLLFFRGFRWPVFLLSLTSLLPLLFISIKWPTFEGDVSPVSNFLNRIIFRFVHLAFWVVCLWVIYEPFYQKALEATPLQFLPFFYITALCIGYLTGYLILVFLPEKQGASHQSAIGVGIGYLIAGVAFASLVVTPVALVQKNLPKIQAYNNGAIKLLANQLASVINTEKKPVIISDDISLLTITGFNLLENGKTNCLLLHSSQLVRHDYQKYLAAKYAGLWPAITNYDQFPEPIASIVLINQIQFLSKNHPVYYLHPSFGYYFEAFYPITRGLVWELKPYNMQDLTPPPVTDEEIKFNAEFWKKTEAESFSLVRQAALLKIPEGLALRQVYSKALNEWGVKLQRNNRLEDAAKFFSLAMAVNPENEVAKVNLEFNTQLRSGKIAPISIEKDMWERFAPHRTIDTIMKLHGSFDHPVYSFIVGNTFFQNGQLRQAASQFIRVASLHRDNIEAGLQMGYLFIQMGRSDLALEQVKKLKTENSPRWQDPTNALALAHMEISAYFSAKQIAEGERILRDLIQKNPKDPLTLQTAAQIYMSYNMFTNAMAIIDRQLELNPDDMDALLNKGVLAMKMNKFDEAIAILTKVLTKQPSNYAALLNRAIAYLQIGKLDESQRDYERILDVYPKLYTAHYGLGEIGFRKKDAKMAIKHFELYLQYAPQHLTERKQVEEKLKQIKSKPA
jgi:tetratricopeptide (TPR) repeat protein